MKLTCTTTLFAVLGLLTSITVALPTSGDGPVSVYTGLEARSANPLGIQGTVMNSIGYVPGSGHLPPAEPREDPNYHNDKQRRAIDTTTEVASKDTELFSITLCNKINHGGTCVEVPMMKNGCQSFPLLVNTRSLYMLGTTQCWVFNNDECHMTGDINDLWIWRWKDTDDLQAVGMNFTPRGWLCDDFS